MANITINGNITGNNNHFGDIYNNVNGYLSEKEGLNFTETEKKLVKIIFENTESEDERLQILNSLENIRSEVIKPNEKEGSLLKIKNFFGKLGKKAVEAGLTSLVTQYSKELPAALHSVKGYLEQL